MVDISKYVNDPGIGDNFDIGVFRRRLVSACNEIASAIVRWRATMSAEELEKVFSITAEISNNGYPRLIVETCGVSITHCDRHEFDHFDELAEFLINAKTVGELP